VSGGTDWRCTTKLAEAGKPGKIFIHIFKWPGNTFELPAVKGKITKAYLLAEPATELKFTQDDQKTSITLPDKAPDAIASVLALEVAEQGRARFSGDSQVCS
jgi:hypothetical protein